MNKSQRKKKKNPVSFRTNILLFIVFLLFTALILQLGMLQIVHGKKFKMVVERTEDLTVSKPVPRGLIYDKNHTLIVDNEPVHAITYTRSKKATTKEMLQTAERLSGLIDVSTDKIQERDLKDFWIIKHPKQARKKITKEELKKVDDGHLEDKDLYQIQLDRITNKEMTSFTKKELEVLAIFREFNSGVYLTPHIVKNKNVTEEEMALVSENLDELPGVDVSVDWNRSYKAGVTLKSILGKTSTSEEGLPQEKKQYYLARDYNMNDRVGKSNLELKYEDVLHGQKAKYRNKLDKNGNILETTMLSEGQRGKDLVLTIDMDLQKKVEKIIEEELSKKKRSGGSPYLDRAFVVLLNPRNGEILALAGKKYEYDEEKKTYVMNDFAQGTYTTAYAMGSTVKAATVLAGYQTGVINPYSVLVDTPIHIKGTPVKKSYKTFGAINDLTALSRSSNVYMFRIAMKVGKGTYIPNAPMKIDGKAFDIMRNHYSEFGLGTRTGIDLPGEQIGFKGTERHIGKLMDFAIGQYDTYTPLQLAQYISTIANGGYRIKPHIVKEIREPVLKKGELGPVYQEIQPTIMNKLSMKDSEIAHVKEGLRRVTQQPGGTGYRQFSREPYRPAGKTGTAEAFYDGPKWVPGTAQPETWNITFATYAPYDNPEIAMSVVVPWAYQGRGGSQMNMEIAKKVYKAYFDSKKNMETPTE